MRYFIIVFILVLSSFCFGQQGVMGKVIDAKSGEALIAATISVNESGTFTEVDGSYKIDLPPGNYELTVSYIGYENLTRQIEVKDGVYTNQEFKLSTSQLLLETATITGSKYERSLAEAPVSISVLSPGLIASNNTTRIDKMIDRVPGVQMIDGQANIRGGSGFSYGAGSRVMLLIDEIPGLQVDAGVANWVDIPVENISQVEVIKGASSVLYGSSAMNGIIHVRTGYATSEPVTKLNLSYNTFSSPEDPKKQWWDKAPNDIIFSGVHKQKFGKLDLVINGFYNDESKIYAEDSSTSGGEDVAMHSQKIRTGAKLRYRISDRLNIGLNSNYTRIDSNTPFLWKNPVSGAYQTFTGAFTLGIKTRFYVDPFLKFYDKKGGKHHLMTRVYYTNNDQNNNQSNKSLSEYVEYQYQKDIKELGLLATTGITTQFTNSDSDLFGDTTFFSRNIAAYAQIEKDFGKDLHVLFGVRLENNVQISPEEFMGVNIPDGKDIDTKFISRGALNYKLGKTSFLRASIGQGYRYPTITERFITTSFGGINIFSNPSLEPETGWSTEIGLKQGFRLGAVNGFLDGAAFWNQYDNMMEFTFVTTPNGAGFRSENVGDIDIKGFEISAAGTTSISKLGVNFLAGYTFIDPKYRNFDGNDALQSSLSSSVELVDGVLRNSDPVNILKYRSKHNFKSDIEFSFKNIRLGANYSNVSRVDNIDLLLANFASIREYRSINNTGYALLDGRISYEYTWKNSFQTKLSFIAKNILNEEYTLRPGLLEAPRNFGIRLDVEF